MESMMTVACPICGKKMQRVGNGTACENCGRMSIPWPMNQVFQKQKTNRNIVIAIIAFLLLYVIPNIIVMLCK